MRLHWLRIVGYWAFTLIIAWELVAGSIWDLLRLEYVRVIFEHLGYPLYLLTIIGLWKLPGAVTLVLPRFPRLKEWAYAGAFFNYSGAAASHFLAGADVVVWLGPAGFAVLTLASWALRPADRRLPSASPGTPTPTVAWIVAACVLIALLVAALLTLPEGPPPPWTYGNLAAGAGRAAGPSTWSVVVTSERSRGAATLSGIDRDAGAAARAATALAR